MKKNIMHLLLLSCAKATELMEKKFHFKLSYSEKIQLELHKMMCEACKRYEKQSEIIEEGIRAQTNAQKNNIEIDTKKLKSQIREKLENNKS
jgi:hypothetical protein